MLADDCVTDVGAVNVVLSGCVREVGLKVIIIFMIYLSADNKSYQMSKNCET